MTDIRNIESGKYNILLAGALKDVDEFESPEWINYVKSGSGKMRPINEPDFWHKRAASILRQFYVRGIVGVGRLRTRYGNRKDRGVKPAHFHKASGKIIRLIVQQAEKAGFVEKIKEKRSGRRLTIKGREFLESVK